MRYVPTPFHTKFAQQRTALSQYIQQEAVGTRMRRWNRPLHDFLLPYVRGAVARVTGEDIIPDEVQHRRDLDTLADMLQFLRAETEAAGDPEHRGRYITWSLPPGHNIFFARAGGGGTATPHSGAWLLIVSSGRALRASPWAVLSLPVPPKTGAAQQCIEIGITELWLSEKPVL